MKLCPKCKAELDDSARFCLRCMTSLDEKEQIQPPTRKKRRWLLVLAICVSLCVVLLVVIKSIEPSDPPEPQETTTTTHSATTTTTIPNTTVIDDEPTVSYTVDGVTYTFRPTTRDEYPTAITLKNHFTLIRVEGTSPNGVYQVPTFVDGDMNAIVCAVADGTFDGTNALAIDLGYNVQYVWGSAFGGYALTDLYLHGDVFIERTAFIGCSKNLTIHCPEYIQNKEGLSWSELAVRYGFQWQEEII